MSTNGLFESTSRGMEEVETKKYKETNSECSNEQATPVGNGGLILLGTSEIHSAEYNTVVPPKE